MFPVMLNYFYETTLFLYMINHFHITYDGKIKLEKIKTDL